MKRRYRDAWLEHRKWYDIRVLGPLMGIFDVGQIFEVGLMGLARVSEIVWILSKVCNIFLKLEQYSKCLFVARSVHTIDPILLFACCASHTGRF